MTDVRIEHTFDCDEHTFWENIFFSEPFNRDMYLKHLQFDQWEVRSYVKRTRRFTVRSR